MSISKAFHTRLTKLHSSERNDRMIASVQSQLAQICAEANLGANGTVIAGIVAGVAGVCRSASLFIHAYISEELRLCGQHDGQVFLVT